MNIKVTKTKKPAKKSNESKSSNDLDIICRRLANIEAMLSFLLEYLVDPDENNIKDEDNEDIKDEDNEDNEEEDNEDNEEEECECECVHGIMIIDEDSGEIKSIKLGEKKVDFDPDDLEGSLVDLLKSGVLVGGVGKPAGSKPVK